MQVEKIRRTSSAAPILSSNSRSASGCFCLRGGGGGRGYQQPSCCEGSVFRLAQCSAHTMMGHAEFGCSHLSKSKDEVHSIGKSRSETKMRQRPPAQPLAVRSPGSPQLPRAPFDVPRSQTPHFHLASLFASRRCSLPLLFASNCCLLQQLLLPPAPWLAPCYSRQPLPPPWSAPHSSCYNEKKGSKRQKRNVLHRASWRSRRTTSGWSHQAARNSWRSVYSPRTSWRRWLDSALAHSALAHAAPAQAETVRSQQLGQPQRPRSQQLPRPLQLLLQPLLQLLQLLSAWPAPRSQQQLLLPPPPWLAPCCSRQPLPPSWPAPHSSCYNEWTAGRCGQQLRRRPPPAAVQPPAHPSPSPAHVSPPVLLHRRTT